MNRKDFNKVYSVPDGYFDRLEDKLAAIPSEYRSRQASDSAFERIRPYLALAASFFLIVAGGSAVIRMSLSRDLDSELSVFERMQLADIVPVTYQDMIYGFEDGYDPESKYEDGIAECLIENGTTLEQIEYYYEEDY